MGQTRLRVPPDVLQHVLGGFPGAALLCSVDVTGVTPSCTQAGKEVRCRNDAAKKKDGKKFKDSFQTEVHLDLKGGAVSLMKTSVWGVAQGCYLQQKRTLKKCGTFFLPDERPSRNHTNDQCIENHFQLDNQTKRDSGESSVEKDRGVLTGPQHPFKKKKWSVKVQLDFTSWGIYRRSRLHFCL